MNERIVKVKELAAQLKALFPECNSVVLDCVGGLREELTLHMLHPSTYQQGVELLRGLGVGKREKEPHAGDMTYTSLTGSVDGVLVRTFPDELPPTCRKVKKVERIPKTQTVVTGEFIEVTREVLECGPEPSDETIAAAQGLVDAGVLQRNDAGNLEYKNITFAGKSPE